MPFILEQERTGPSPASLEMLNIISREQVDMDETRCPDKETAQKMKEVPSSRMLHVLTLCYLFFLFSLVSLKVSSSLCTLFSFLFSLFARISLHFAIHFCTLTCARDHLQSSELLQPEMLQIPSAERLHV